MNTLEDWERFVAVQIERLDARGSASSWRGGPTELVEHVQGEAVLEAPALERAIRQFGRTLHWPALTSPQAFFLIQRLRVGAAALAEWRRFRPPTTLPQPSSPMPPDPNAQAAFVEWLLVQLWNLQGEAHLAWWAQDFLKWHRLRPPARRTQ